MTTRKIALIHTSQVLVPMFSELCGELLPDTEIQHIADDSLIKDAIALGSLNDSIVSRLQNHIRQAEQAGASAIMVTCSSMGPAIEASMDVASVPLLRVDQAMADRAVSMASKIGVIATVSTTLGPTADLIQRRASAADKKVEVVMCLCDGALEKLLSGDVATHDRLVTERLLQLSDQVEVVVLAQASMARVANSLPQDGSLVPVLSSPRLAIATLAQELGPSPARQYP